MLSRGTTVYAIPTSNSRASSAGVVPTAGELQAETDLRLHWPFQNASASGSDSTRSGVYLSQASLQCDGMGAKAIRKRGNVRLGRGGFG